MGGRVVQRGPGVCPPHGRPRGCGARPLDLEIIPGLLQAEQYMRRLYTLSDPPSAKETDRLVRARLQRRVPPGAPIQGNNLDRNEMSVSGARVDHAQDQGRAAHSEVLTTCRPVSGSPGPTGGRANSPWSPMRTVNQTSQGNERRQSHRQVPRRRPRRQP